MKQITLILGNGFDLDLGLKTRYSDFAGSPEWHFFENSLRGIYNSRLVNHMNNAKATGNWFDIEEEIRKFVNNINELNDARVGLIREEHCQLLKSLRFYLSRVAIRQNLKEGTLAEDLLWQIHNSNHVVGVYTFNYTDCYELCGIKKNVKLNHIHGSLNYGMLFGCRNYDGGKDNLRLDFLYKPYTKVFDDMLTQNLSIATETIIFGHSLNKIDHCYFKGYFDFISNNECRGKHLTIICYDDKSEKGIRDNLLSSGVNLNSVKIPVDFIYTVSLEEGQKDSQMKYQSLCQRISIE